MDKILKALNKAREEGNGESSVLQERDDKEKSASADNRKENPSGAVIALKSAPAKGKTEKTESSGKSEIDPKLIVYHAPESLAAEHFKLIRSRFVNPPDGRECRTILVTSAMDNAGKTLIACNLALSIAQGVDPYALLIDADIRKPSVHRMFALQSDTGLSEYLNDEVNLPDCLMRSVVSKLTILPAGRQVSNPAEIVVSSKMKNLIEEAKSRYHDRFIIIDSPPVNLASETVDLAKLVDAVLFVVRSGVSSKPLVEEAINRIGRERIMGFVFNCYQRPSGKYGYYSKKSAYYG